MSEDNYNKPYKSNLDYAELINRKTFKDRFADALNKQADSMGKPMNVRQANSQALIRGFAAGFSHDSEREAKLAELESMAKEATMFNHELQMQSGRNAKKKADRENFFTSNAEDLAMMSDAIVSGNHTQVDMLAPDILSSYQKITGYGKDMTYKHYKNGLYTFQKADGSYNTINVKDLFAEVYDNLPDEQKKRYRGFASRRQLIDMDAEEKLRNLKIQEAQSRIANVDADTDLIKAKTSSAREEMLNPPMTDSQKILFKANVDNNQEYLKEAGKKNITDLALVQTLNELEEMIIESAKKGQVGSDISAIRKRGWDKYISGDNKAMTIVDMAKATYFGRIKEAGGSNPSTTEFLTALSTMPNTDKNLSANLRIINKDRDNALRNILKFNKMEKNLRDREYQGSPYDPAVHGFSDEEYNNFRKENNKNKVVVIRTAKLGTPLAEPEVAEIGADELENYIADGFEIYYE